MGKTRYVIQATKVPTFYSSYSKWNTIGNKFKVSYIYTEKKGRNGKSD